MNILWIAPYPVNPGQHPAPWILMLAKNLVKEGQKLTILTPSSKIEGLTKKVAEDGYQVILLPYKGGVRHLLSLFNTQINALSAYLETTQEKYDVIHIHGTESQYASSIIRSNVRTPYVISIQGIINLTIKELKNSFSRHYLYWKISSFYERKEIRGTRHFLCRTHWDQQFVRSMNTEADIEICWEILRPEFFEYTHPFSGNDILYMGGDNTLKGLENCLKVFNKLAKDKKNIRLHIIGAVRPAKVSATRSALALEYINEKNLLLHGSLNAGAICAIYQECFCLYHPSLIDNSPNSVCEAQVAGLPVIATNVGGVSSLITHGKTGLMVGKNDIEAHFNTLEILYKDKNLQHHLGENARIMARKRHDKKHIVDQIVHLYKKLSAIQHA